MHKGRAYHEYMLASRRDLEVRKRFQNLVIQFTPYKGTILDFGAGTGIDARAYADKGFKTLVYEPCDENRAFLAGHCQHELESGAMAFADLAPRGSADVIAANFAVLNLIADHVALFAAFEGLLATKGYVVVNMLNPFFVGDARYDWWWENLFSLLRHGDYAVCGQDGPIYRFTPAATARAAGCSFRRAKSYPDRLRLPMSQYMFMVFQKLA